MSGKRVKNKMSISIFCIILFAAAYLYMTSDSYRLKMGNKHYDKGNYKSAVKYFSKIKEVEIDTLLRKSKGEVELKKYNEALETLEAIEEKSLAENIGIDLVDFYYDKVTCLEAYGKWDKIMELSDDYLKIPKGTAKNEMIESYIIHAYNLYGKYSENAEFIHSYIHEYEGIEDRNYIIELYRTLSICYLRTINKVITGTAGYATKPSDTLYSPFEGIADKVFETYDKLIYYEPDNLINYLGKAMMYEKLYGTQKSYDYLVSVRKLFGFDKAADKRFIDAIVEYENFYNDIVDSIVVSKFRYELK